MGYERFVRWKARTLQSVMSILFFLLAVYMRIISVAIYTETKGYTGIYRLGLAFPKNIWELEVVTTWLSRCDGCLTPLGL